MNYLSKVSESNAIPKESYLIMSNCLGFLINTFLLSTIVLKGEIGSYEPRNFQVAIVGQK